MMAKMFYTLDEAKSALGRSEEEIKQFAREGRLREFRDGPRLMFKADQVEQLRAELSGDQVTLGGPAESGAPIGLADSRSSSASGIPLADSDVGGRSPGAAMPPKDDTAMAADLGLSGSLGGIPSPGRPGAGGSITGSGMTGSRAGINVLGDTGEADPMAQTAMSPAVGDVNLEGVGSGSGLLDLTRESDDTSLGAELLDEIAPGRTGGPVESGVGTGVAAEAMAAAAGPRRGTGMPVYAVEARDPSAGFFGGMALGAAAFMLLGLIVVAAAVADTTPPLVQTLIDLGGLVLLGIGAGLAIIFGIVGLIVGKAAR